VIRVTRGRVTGIVGVTMTTVKEMTMTTEPAIHLATQTNGECADPHCECHALATTDVRELPPLVTTTPPRDFPAVLNEWLDAVLEENQKADITIVALILRLGTLGQRLLYEANTLGMNEALKMATERMEGR
jgi:hypothetical protein